MPVYRSPKFCLPFWLSSLAIAVLLFTRSVAEAQEKSTLRVQVELATVEVVALGHDGAPVLNLSQKDFTVLENGKERKILSFDIIGESKRGNLPRSLEDLDEQSRKGKVVLIFFDDGSISPRQVVACREAAAKYVQEHMEPWDLFAVARFGTHLIVDQNFTHDVGAVERALRQPATSVVPRERRSALSPELLPDATVSVPGSSRRNQIDQQPEEELGFREANLARSLSSLSASLSLIKGRKSVVFFGSALSSAQVSAGTPGSGRRSDAGRDLQEVVQSAAGQKVTYYPVDPRDSFALNKVMKQVQDELSQYYVLGYEPTEGRPDQPREIELKCGVSGVKLKYPKLQTPARSADALAGTAPEESLLKAVNSGVSLGQVPLTFRAAHFPGADNLNWVTISALIQRSGVKFSRKKDTLVARINALGAAFDPEGSLVARFSETFNIAFDRAQKEIVQGQAIPYRHTLKLPSGRYNFRLAVSDEQGKIGLAEKEIDIPKARSDQLTMSSLIISQQVSLLPDLVRDINTELLQSEDPLLVNGIQIELPVEYKLSRKAPIIVFYKVSNLGDRDAAKRLVAVIQFVSASGSIVRFPDMPLSEVVQVDNLGVARVALKLPIANLTKGVQNLRVETKLGTEGKSVVAQESVEITD